MTNHYTPEPSDGASLILPDGWGAELLYDGVSHSVYMEHRCGAYIHLSKERNPTAAVAAANEVLVALAKSVLAKVEGGE